MPLGASRAKELTCTFPARDTGSEDPMSSRLDYSKSKRKKSARFGERIDRNTRGVGPSRSWRNLRTEWDGDPFPVVTRSVTETGEASQTPGQRAGRNFGESSQDLSQCDASHGTGSVANPKQTVTTLLEGRQGRQAVEIPADPDSNPEARAYARGRQAA